MAHHARIEEVSDSDSDPPDMDPSEYAPQQELMLPIRGAPPASANTPQVASSIPAGGIPVMNKSAESQERLRQQRAMIKEWCCVYPVYFDATRTRAQGRRVSKAQAVLNPLAGEIAEAARSLGLMPFVELGKMHPKDWANPGRVRIKLREDDAWTANMVNNKHHLYVKIAEYLRENPVTEETPLKLPIQGIPNPKVIPPAVPRGWKMGNILPLHSPAVSGGGVSENMIKDMMAEMGGEGGPGAPALPPGMANMFGGGGGGGGGGSGAEKKVKKDKKKGKG